MEKMQCGHSLRHLAIKTVEDQGIVTVCVKCEKERNGKHESSARPKWESISERTAKLSTDEWSAT